MNCMAGWQRWIARQTKQVIMVSMCKNPIMQTDRVLLLTLVSGSCMGWAAFAQGWNQTTAPNANWVGITSSADGSNLVATAAGSGIWTSQDSGLTWVSNNVPPGISWSAIASSADGNKKIAVTRCSGGNVGVWTSTGLAWSSTNLPCDPFSIGPCAVASSANGEKLVVVTSSGSGAASVWTSPDGGLDWVSNNIPGAFHTYLSAASSADARVLAVGSYVGLIYVSTNSGLSWNTNDAPSGIWQAIACSADGARLVATMDNGGIYSSTNSGTTWATNNAPRDLWQSIASSGDGTKLIAGSYHVYTSTNSGFTWVSNNVSSASRIFAASSADGNRLVYAAPSGGIYASATTPTPLLNSASSSNALLLSWGVPSTTFTLQQSSDLIHWTDVTNRPALNLNTLRDTITVPLSGANGFYWLKAP
jgi:hypothetical protein